MDSSEQLFIGRDYQTKNDFSEKLASEADDEIREILDYNYARAKKILSENMNFLHEMAKLLLDQETINKEEVDMLAQGKSAEEVGKYMEEKREAQHEKEELIKKQQIEDERRRILENKLKEGEKLLESGVITKEEFEAIKNNIQKEFDKVENDKNYTVNIQQGKNLEQVIENNEKPVQEEKKEEIENKQDTKKEETPNGDDNKGE